MDRKLFEAIHHRRYVAADYLSLLISGVTEYALIWFAVAGYLIFTSGKEGQVIAATMLAALGVAVFITHGLFRVFIQRPRPYVVVPSVRRVGYTWVTNSFPSGHVSTTVAMIWVLAANFSAFMYPALIITLALMWSRIYNGMHWPSDVVAGALVGALSGYLALLILDSNLLAILS